METAFQALRNNCVVCSQDACKLCAVRIVLLSQLCEEAYCCCSDTMINCEERNVESKNRIEKNILECKKKSTKRVHKEDHEEVLCKGK